MGEADEPGTQGGADDGTTAVLYGMFASFTEALDRFDGRLAAIEEALRAGPGETAERLRAIEAALAGIAGGGGGGAAGAADASDALAAVRSAVDARVAGVEAALADRVGEVDRRTAAVQEAVEELRRLLQDHADVTSHSLGRRAGEAGRRLVADLGLRARTRSAGGPPASGPPG